VNADLARMREAMVSQVTVGGRPVSGPVAEALRAVPRHVFLPDLPPVSAYRDEAIVTKRGADGQPISSSSQPTIMAIMLDQLGLAPRHRVLEIGAGTGYNAALMKRIVGAEGDVVTVDIDPDVAERARAHLMAASYPDVTVVCGDGAAGYPAGAPYDRMIATVGVSDLAPAWLGQLAPGGRIVVPLDVRGTQRSVAFEQAGGAWQSRSVVPCGFMRIRGTLAGPERTQVTRDDKELAVTLPDDRELDIAAVSRALAGPAAEYATDVVADPAQLFDGLGLWLTLHEPRWGMLSAGGPAGAALLGRAPVRIQDRRVTAGIFEGDSLAALMRPDAPGDRPHPPRPWPPRPRAPGPWAPDRRDRQARVTEFALSVLGYGPHGPELARKLADLLRAWDAAGRPGTGGLRISAYPKPASPASGASATGSPPRAPAAGAASGPPAAGDAIVIDRPHTTFVVYPEPAESPGPPALQA
jgi:protein-L-isoaspartate(D-aspartate) O-methyltransferase